MAKVCSLQLSTPGIRVNGNVQLMYIAILTLLDERLACSKQTGI